MGLLACVLAINQTVQRVIKTTPYQMVYGKEMRRFQILPVAMRERIQIEEKLTEESSFDISDAEEQLMLDMAGDMVSGVPPIRNDSHTSSQPLESVQDSSSNDILDQDQ